MFGDLLRRAGDVVNSVIEAGQQAGRSIPPEVLSVLGGLERAAGVVFEDLIRIVGLDQARAIVSGQIFVADSQLLAQISAISAGKWTVGSVVSSQSGTRICLQRRGLISLHMEASISVEGIAISRRHKEALVRIQCAGFLARTFRGRLVRVLGNLLLLIVRSTFGTRIWPSLDLGGLRIVPSREDRGVLLIGFADVDYIRHLESVGVLDIINLNGIAHVEGGVVLRPSFQTDPAEVLMNENELPAGECPWCKEEVRAVLLEVNSFPRRNIYSCPKCSGQVLKCYTPGCDNTARWGDYWDDYYCPDCTLDGGPLGAPGRWLKSIIGLGGNASRAKKQMGGK